MELFGTLWQAATQFIPSLVTACIFAVLLFSAHTLLTRRYADTPGFRFKIPLIMLGLTLFGGIAVIGSLPFTDSVRGQRLGLVGLLLSAAITLSATTFVGNMMAGLMQRAVRSFYPGDFIMVGDHFGRVFEQGLFHVEIQMENRDLTTLPNLYLVTNPVRVIRSSGTLVNAEVSLGYDVPQLKVKEAL